MKLDAPQIQELIEFDPEFGVVKFAGERAVIVDATALGSLRKHLIDQCGDAAARGILTQFGFIHGWRLAEAALAMAEGDDDVAWRGAVARLPVLQGMYYVSEDADDPLSKEGVTLLGSYEADQHVAHLGRSEVAVCWTICGLFSGYLSRTLGQEIFVLEERCMGRGDSTCRMLGRTREEWGDERAEELKFFHVEHLSTLLDSTLHGTIKKLRDAEQSLAEMKRTLARITPEQVDRVGLVARSDAMRRLVDLAGRIASVDATVLITGESGTGKERIARFVHDRSQRAAGAFIAVNCGAITESLLESELFGHKRGAFTGAAQDRAGLFEAANGGTLLLDEISDVSPGMQSKLLRVLQEREVRRVGENHSRPVNVRVIAATNKLLSTEITAGAFREDLYYRLNVVELHLPALRNRREDILPLARTLLAEASLRFNRPMSGLAPRAADQLQRYDWPGNVRELQNVMERAVALARISRVEYEDLPEEVRQAIAVPTVSSQIKELGEVEQDYIMSVLDYNDGNQTLTAKQLGIGTATLYRKLKKYGEAAKNPQGDA